MSYQVIRASSDYQVVVVVQPPEADPYDKGVKVYVHNGNVEPNPELFFQEINPEVALITYFSGQADAMGFGEKPQQVFSSLDEVEAWVRQAQHQAMWKAAFPAYDDKGPTLYE